MIFKALDFIASAFSMFIAFLRRTSLFDGFSLFDFFFICLVFSMIINFLKLKGGKQE